MKDEIMSTTAYTPIKATKCIHNDNAILPQRKSTRQIVREELQRQKELKELEVKHKSGEISEFSYRAQRALLEMKYMELPQNPERIFSTIA
jgi:hypothetical protein